MLFLLIEFGKMIKLGFGSMHTYATAALNGSTQKCPYAEMLLIRVD
jgi:hypothetical protein